MKFPRTALGVDEVTPDSSIKIARALAEVDIRVKIIHEQTVILEDVTQGLVKLLEEE